MTNEWQKTLILFIIAFPLVASKNASSMNQLDGEEKNSKPIYVNSRYFLSSETENALSPKKGSYDPRRELMEETENALSPKKGSYGPRRELMEETENAPSPKNGSYDPRRELMEEEEALNSIKFEGSSSYSSRFE